MSRFPGLLSDNGANGIMQSSKTFSPPSSCWQTATLRELGEVGKPCFQGPHPLLYMKLQPSTLSGTLTATLHWTCAVVHVYHHRQRDLVTLSKGPHSTLRAHET
ncbi:hypothetical protein MN608_02086 [Microdochium nivale]|nr:hypothetical protein MN608_02086 [Microdochium nivale]